MLRYSVILLLCCFFENVISQRVLIIPDQIFDGENLLSGYQVLVNGKQIEAIGKNLSSDAGTKIIQLKGKTLMPGIIEGHAHILLHPYNETSWNDQVLFESEAERVIRAREHLRVSLLAGITTIRDLGTEGAGYADIGIKQAISKGVIIAPDLICSGKAIVATGSYGPKSPAFNAPPGAEPADGKDVIRIVRDQIGHGVDFIKIYADYRWGAFGKAMPTFSIDEIKVMVETAASSGRMVVAHAATREGMRRAILGGVKTIEHGDEADEEIYALMKEYDVALCPTLAAGEAILTYRGWNKSNDSLPDRIKEKQRSFKSALKSGVKILMGGDVGVFSHGDNVREMILMKEYGMAAKDILKSATLVNATVFGLTDRGQIRKDKIADLIALDGNPIENINAIKKVSFVMRAGKIIKE